MNQRIQELAEKAGIEFDDSFSSEPETIYYLKLSDFEKFAELIVEECASRIQNYVDHRIPASQYSELLIKDMTKS